MNGDSARMGFSVAIMDKRGAGSGLSGHDFFPVRFLFGVYALVGLVGLAYLLLH